MPYDITITRADNGYVLSYWEEVGDGDDRVNKNIVVEEEQDETKATQKLLWAIIEYFNLAGSKHDPVRVRIYREDNNGKVLQD